MKLIIPGSFYANHKREIIAAIGITLFLVISVLIWPIPTWQPSSYYVQQPESIRLTNLHIWVTNNNNTSVTAFAVINVGARDLTLDNISIKGLSIPHDSWYYHNTDSDGVLYDVKDRLKPDYSPDSVDIDSRLAGEEGFIRASEPILLKPGEAVIVYVLNPEEINATYQDPSIVVSVKAGAAQSVQAVKILFSD